MRAGTRLGAGTAGQAAARGSPPPRGEASPSLGALRGGPGPGSRCARSAEGFPVPWAEGRPGTRTQSPPRSGAGPPAIRPAARPPGGCDLRGRRGRAPSRLGTSGKGARGRGVLGCGNGARQPRAPRGDGRFCAGPRRGCPSPAFGRGPAATGRSGSRRPETGSRWARGKPGIIHWPRRKRCPGRVILRM